MSTTATKPPCPDPDCHEPHVVRNGTLKGRQRYHCRGCGAWFGETHNTPMYRLRTSPQEIGRALLVVMRRGSLRAAEEVTGHKYGPELGTMPGAAKQTSQSAPSTAP